MKKRQLINEIMGVPKAVDTWVNYMSSVTVTLVDDIIEKDEWESKEIDYEGEDYLIHRGVIELSGKGFTEMVTNSMYGGDIKKLLNSKEFGDFPLYNPTLRVQLLILPDKIYNNQEEDVSRMEATHSYNDQLQNIKIGNLGKVKIFSKNSFEFKVIIPASYVSNRTEQHQEKLFNKLIPTVSHELTHSYQTYMQLLGGKETIGYGKETVLNMLPQNLKYPETPSWNNFLHLVYLSLSFEVNARVTELYYVMKRKNVKTKDEALKVLLDSDSWDDYKQLKNFNADKFIKEFVYHLPEQDPLRDFFDKMLGRKKPKIPSSGDEIMINLIDRWDRLIQNGQEQIRELGVDIPFMDKVPQKAKENPIEFFKFFEKRFHTKAEDLKRKLTKIVSLVTQENE
jgi:hypothetical protein